MKKILDLITGEMVQAFTEAGYDASYAKVSLSNRPDLCEYQCNGAMAAAKTYKKAPIMIANAVVEKLEGSKVFSGVSAVNPGFINLKLDNAFLADYLQKMQADENLSIEKAAKPKKIMIDYGGPNVAKPLHVGHLRSAIIGESIKRMGRLMGHEVIGDVHLGDWGLQMGLIITELKTRKPELVYFEEAYEGEYPDEARETAKIVGLAAIKYGDLSNQASKDYVFDVDRFTSFEGNTGPYILYTIVRIKSILNKYQAGGGKLEGYAIGKPASESEKALMLVLSRFNSVMENAFEEIAPHKICSYIYDLANEFNRFYHETKILSEENEQQKAGWIQLLKLTKDVLERCIDTLGFSAPERM